ncbi:MAG: hypothetical protein ACTHU0_32295 [Kofleriaceae bacterium]
MPAYASGDKRGMHVPLYEKLASEPKMQQMMTRLATRISSADPDKLDVAEIWNATQQDARMLSADDPWAAASANTPKSNVMALQAMATLMNAQKFNNKDHPLPKEIADKLPPELWKKIDAAQGAMLHSKSPKAAVMSHGVQAEPPKDATKPFSIDNNYHFFSHAYLTASLAHEHGVRPHQAEAISGFIGAQYELLPGSLGEHSGNSALKDVLVNAEGARFGTSLLSNPATLLPGMYDGPPPEDRSIPNVKIKNLPPGVKRISDDASDMSTSHMILKGLGGALQNDVDSKLKIQEETGLPVGGTPRVR